MRKIRNIFPYFAFALAGGAMVFFLAATGCVASFDNVLHWAKQYVVERRAQWILSSSAVSKTGNSSAAEIRMSSACVGQVVSCTYSETEYTLDIREGKGRVYMRRYFHSGVVPPQSIDNQAHQRCILVSEDLAIAPQEVQRILNVLSLPNFLDFRSISGGESTDTSSSYLDVTLNGRHVSVSMLGPDSTPERLRKLAGAIHALAEGKVTVPEHWPSGKKCHI